MGGGGGLFGLPTPRVFGDKKRAVLPIAKSFRTTIL